MGWVGLEPIRPISRPVSEIHLLQEEHSLLTGL